MTCAYASTLRKRWLASVHCLEQPPFDTAEGDVYVRHNVIIAKFLHSVLWADELEKNKPAAARLLKHAA